MSRKLPTNSVATEGLSRQRLPKAAELLAADLRAQILGNSLEPGTSLPSESQLARDLGYGRATVREALRLLESDGLIRIRRGPTGGIKVAQPDVGHIERAVTVYLSSMSVKLRDLFEFRRSIEPEAAALASTRSTDAQKRRLVELADEDCGERGHHLKFHLLIIRLAHNELWTMMFDALANTMRLHVDQEHFSQRDLSGTSDAHRKIARAIEESDAKAAYDSMDNHLRQFGSLMEQAGRLDEPIVLPSSWLNR